MAPNGPLTGSFPGLNHVMDGLSIADGHVELPVGLSGILGRLLAHVLAGPGPQ